MKRLSEVEKRTTMSSASTQPSASCKGTWTGRAAWVC